jgi:hypothetical protein
MDYSFPSGSGESSQFGLKTRMRQLDAVTMYDDPERS